VGLSANVECRSETVAHGSLKIQDAKIAKKSPSGHHPTTLLGYIFATKACIDNRKKNLLSSNISSTCTQRISRLGSVTARYSSSGRQPNFAPLNRGRHLHSAGRPSRWALAHISSSLCYSGTRAYSFGTSIIIHPVDNKRHIRCVSYKTWQYIFCDHNSGKTRLIFIIFALL